jgi:hypothetical protein
MMAVSWVVNLAEERRVPMKETASTPETSVSSYQTTRRNSSQTAIFMLAAVKT